MDQTAHATSQVFTFVV
jgi:chromosome partitioning protein